MTIPPDFRGSAIPLAPRVDVAAEAARLNCTVAIIHAFSDVESSGGGFLKTKEPKILFEARYFHLLTKGKYDRLAPNISSPVWDRSLYGAAGLHQYDRLKQAMRLDQIAALKSCSIGRYQVMGANFRMLNFLSVEDMWAMFCASEAAHLKGFGDFIKAAGLLDEMQTDPPEFAELAAGYNGAGYRANGYDQKLETAFVHYAALGENVIPKVSGETGFADDPTAPPLPPPSIHIGDRALRSGMVGEDVRILQMALNQFPGGPIIPADGIFGRNRTLAAVIAFQQQHKLRPVDGIAGHDTLSALGLI